jgi:hypothetical protein
MAILKKGSRRIVVDGRSFRWRVRHRPTYDQALCASRLILAAEAANGLGSKLVVVLPQVHPSSWMGYPSQPVLPSQVAHYIRQAVGGGWKPTQSGKPFLLDASEPTST